MGLYTHGTIPTYKRAARCEVMLRTAVKYLRAAVHTPVLYRRPGPYAAVGYNTGPASTMAYYIFHVYEGIDW